LSTPVFRLSGYQPAWDAVEVAEGRDVRLGPRVLVQVQDRPDEHVA
jgi:hypothetical protein